MINAVIGTGLFVGAMIYVTIAIAVYRVNRRPGAPWTASLFQRLATCIGAVCLFATGIAYTAVMTYNPSPKVGASPWLCVPIFCGFAILITPFVNAAWYDGPTSKSGHEGYAALWIVAVPLRWFMQGALSLVRTMAGGPARWGSHLAELATGNRLSLAEREARIAAAERELGIGS